jgi:hypothetical protein
MLSNAMKRFLPLLVAGALLAAPGTVATAMAAENVHETNTGLTDAEVRKFFTELQRAASTRDVRGMAALTKFPLRVNGKVSVKNRREFIVNYRKIIKKRVRLAVEKQRYETLFSNYQGVMIGDGELWFARVCDQPACTTQSPRIVAVNNE